MPGVPPGAAAAAGQSGGGMPPWMSQMIGIGAQTGQSLLNMGFQRRENTRSRQFALDMYNQQRSDALSDWNAQNFYNSPAEMMKRLKAAGLNPNLAYGNPTTAGQASSPRSASQGNYKGEAPQMNIPINDMIMMFYDIQKTQAQTDNIKANTDLVKERDKKIDWEVEKLISDITGRDKSNRMSDLDYYIKDTQEKQGKFNAETSKAINQADQSQYEAQLTKIKAYVADQVKSNSIQQVAENLIRTQQMTAESKQRVQNLIKSGKLQDFEIQLNRMGFTRNDPYYIRAAVKLIDEVIKEVTN